MNEGGLVFHISSYIVKKIIAILVNAALMNSLFILYYWQNSTDRIKVCIFINSVKKVVSTLKLPGSKDTWVSENIQRCVCMSICVCEAGDRYLAVKQFNVFQKRISDLFSRAIL